jgi:hypothetical protein
VCLICLPLLQASNPALDKDDELHKRIDELVHDAVKKSVGPVTDAERTANLKAYFSSV